MLGVYICVLNIWNDFRTYFVIAANRIHDQGDEVPNVEDEVVAKRESHFKNITTKEDEGNSNQNDKDDKMEECEVSKDLKCSGVNAV